MKKLLILLALCLTAVAADAPCPQWPHSKKYPCEVLKVISPTEFRVKLAEDGKTYTIRLAHVKPVEKKKIPKEMTNSSIFKTFDNAALSRINHWLSPVDANGKKKEISTWVEFEGDDLPRNISIIRGYLFSSEREDFPLNALLTAAKLHSGSAHGVFISITQYTQENKIDSKGKPVFDWALTQNY